MLLTEAAFCLRPRSLSWLFLKQEPNSIQLDGVLQVEAGNWKQLLQVKSVRSGEAAFFGFFFSFILFFFFFWFARKRSQKRKSFLIGETMSNKHVIVMYAWHIAFYVNGVSKIAWKYLPECFKHSRSTHPYIFFL